MRELIAAGLLLCAGLAQASTVTITFDDPANESVSCVYDPYLEINECTMETLGFLVTAIGFGVPDGDTDKSAISWACLLYTSPSPRDS